MISQKAIQYLYQQFDERPESSDFLDLNLLFDIPEHFHNIKIDEKQIEIGSICSSSPFHSIALDHINAIVDLEENIAIVLNSSIVFLSKKSKEVSIDIKAISLSFTDRLANLFSNII